MKNIKEYICENMVMKLTKKQKEKLLELDKKYGELILHYREVHNSKDILNFSEERDKFVEMYERGEKYYPTIKMNPDKEDLRNIVDRFKELKFEFENIGFYCLLTKYYLYSINFLIHFFDFTIRRDEGDVTLVEPNTNTITDEIYKEAVNILKTYKYEKNVKSNRDKDANYALEKIKAAIDELGYDWDVKIYDNMVPRMNVLPNGIVRINKNAKFSDVDIQGLIAHEIKGHVGRRFYGKKLGLNLFLNGLYSRNIYDEGLAVWNSLNIVDEPKPNILFNIALKCFIAYNAQRLDYYDLFVLCKKTCPQIENKKLAASILRNKRNQKDTHRLGGDFTDASYYIGWREVNKMTDAERDDILKWNIGPEQFKDLDRIKAFFKINKFKPIT